MADEADGAPDDAIEGRGLLQVLAYGLRWAGEWIVDTLAEWLFGWW